MSASLSAASRGVLLGACAGLVLALNDFGALWLWLDMGSDRWALLSRLIGLEVPVGAWLGATFGLIVSVLRRAVLRLRPSRSLECSFGDAVVLASAPACVWVGWQLFTGGSASRLPFTWLLKPLATIVLMLALWITSVVLHRLVLGVRGRDRALPIAAVLFGLTLALIKLNQWVLPNLYNYLHGVLALCAFALCAVGIGLAATRSSQLVAWLSRYPRGALVLLLPLSGWLVSSVEAIPANQNVAVALLDARAGHSRSLMLAAAPLLHDERSRERKPPVPRPSASATSAALAGAHQAPGAHVLLITIDALRADHLGLYGYRRPTSPQLDQLAASSLVFERAYAQAPHSSYSLSSLMTSEYLHETLDLGAPAPEDTLARTLARTSYHTAAFYTLGIFHTAAERLRLYEQNAFGFALHDHQDRAPEDLTDRVLQEIDRTVAQGEPSTLLWAHYFNVHEPYRATTFGSSDMDRYDSEILRADAAVARLIREARRRLKREVIVVITADHGEEFREHGGVYHGSALYEEQVRVPLIVNAPRLAPKRIHAPVEVIDIAPTLLGMVDVPRPSSMRGDDLRALIDNEANAPLAFSAVIHKRMVVKWPYKLIADLRFGHYELYALDRDPHERKNLAGSEPQLLAALRDEVYGWLDSLALKDAAHDDPRMIAIDQGRLGDRRAVPMLLDIIQDEAAPTPARREAGMILGKLADPKATSGLLEALSAKDSSVVAEAAIALGRMHNAGGQSVLQRLVLSEDPDVRSRAAVSLGRLRDTLAVPALIDTLWIAPNDYEREEAIRWLGRLRDSRAIEPLISLLPESRTRHLVVVALGAIGDPRGFDTLRDVLRWEDHADIRDNVIRGLGMLKDPRGLDLVLPLAVTEPGLKYATESLVRLDAIARGAIGGADMNADAKLQGFHRCTAFSERHDWDYLHRSVCETARAQASIELSVPTAITHTGRGASVAIALRRMDAQEPASIRVQVGDQSLQEITVDGAWMEHRLPLNADVLATDHLRATLTATPSTARFIVDHVLLLPR